MTASPVGPPTEPLPTCYRHADRRAGVTCQRCNRPICPACMITASVGFQCPECARAGAKQSRTISAGQVLRAQGTPVVTYALLAINVAVFFVGAIVDRSMNVNGQVGPFEVRWALINHFVGQGEWYRLITSGFMHFGPLHLAFNMWALWVIGQPLERLLGRGRFLLVYFTALLGGSLGGVLLQGRGDVGAGASGALYGLFGAIAVLELLQGVNPLRSQIGQVIGINLVLTIVLGFSLGAHLGGLVIGAGAAGVLLAGTPLRRQTQGERAARASGVAVLGLACLGAALAIAKARYGLG